MVSKTEVVHRIERLDTILYILEDLRALELRELEEIEMHIKTSGPAPLEDCELLRGRIEKIEPAEDGHVLVTLVKEGTCTCCNQAVRWVRKRYLPGGKARDLAIGMVVELFRSEDEITVRDLEAA